MAADLLRAVQSAILVAASTMHVWRDAAVLVLAGIVIVLLHLAYGAWADG